MQLQGLRSNKTQGWTQRGCSIPVGPSSCHITLQVDRKQEGESSVPPSQRKLGAFPEAPQTSKVSLAHRCPTATSSRKGYLRHPVRWQGGKAVGGTSELSTPLISQTPVLSGLGVGSDLPPDNRKPARTCQGSQSASIAVTMSSAPNKCNVCVL